MIWNLASLVAPEREELFVRHFVDKKRLAIMGGGPDRVEAMLPWDTVNALISSGSLPYEHLRLIRSNQFIPYKMFCRPGERPEIRVSAVQQLVSQGASIIVNRLDKYVVQVGRLCDELERQLGHDVQVNCYLSFSKEHGFLAHHDGHDVIILQVHGRKRWRSFGMMKPAHRNKSASEMSRDCPEWEDILSPGDVLYLPRGEVHDASAVSADSLHLTIGIHSRNGIDLVDKLKKIALEDEVFLTDLTRLGGSAVLAEHEVTLKNRLHKLIDGIDLTSFLEEEDAGRPPRALLSLPPTASLRFDTTVALLLRRSIKIPIDGDENGGTTIGGETFSLSRAERIVLSYCLQAPATTFGALLAEMKPAVSESEMQTTLLSLAHRGLVALISAAGPDEQQTNA